MARVQVALKALVPATRTHVTAVEVNGVLPTGLYSILAAQAGLVGGIPAHSGFITSYRDKDSFQLQEFRSVWAAETWTRSKAGDTWAAWVKISG